MKLFNRYESCVGLTLFRLFKYNIEIWYCPKEYEIVPHSHPEEDIELMYIFGKTTFFRQCYSGAPILSVIPRMPFKCHSVPAGYIHWFKVSKTFPLIFINIAKFRRGFKPKSASVDFKKT
jgi:hypothetical protein